MRLCINKRWRLVHLFETHNLHLVKNKFGKLRDIGLQEGINLSKRGCQDLINKWRTYGDFLFGNGEQATSYFRI